MNRQFKRILDLVRRTGDRIVVTDPDGEESYVVMGLDQYEALIRDENEDDDEWEPEWSPEMYGDLIPTEPIDRSTSAPIAPPPVAEAPTEPNELRKAVERDLAVIDSWEQEKREVQKPKTDESSPKFNPDEERFYLEPIE